ncbi:hypothetical protein RI844_02185 [Thalassotalea fonticola]|uniref:Uncharacterized protein n=1 Tax=Thalassotalea fonticola TaxID=3065649 RepID=A0ABZ0GRS8_9GAMM|nr:hypothetical protein RI844_02185 [Colwelliaceae bacterium S1-1]
MTDVNSDNEQLRDNYLVTSVEFAQHISPLESSSADISINDETHNMWWLNTRRRCHKHSSLKRNYIRRNR